MSLDEYQETVTLEVKAAIAGAREALADIEQGFARPDEFDLWSALHDQEILGGHVARIREWLGRLDGYSDATSHRLSESDK